jgi:hypothetical protein
VHRLPNHRSAIIEDRKLTGYLLSPDHEEGGPKCKFLEGFGFSRHAPQVLGRALIQHAASAQIVAIRRTDYGMMYEVNGPIVTPGGKNPWVLVVWSIDTGSDRPRLVTLMPSEEHR